MPIALTPNETWEYQLDDDYLERPLRDESRKVIRPGKPNPDVAWWTMRALPAAIQQRIVDAVLWDVSGGKEILHANRGTTQRMVLEHCVVSVRNWKDEKGQEIQIKMTKQGTADLAFLDYLTPAHRAELASAGDSRWKVSVSDSD